VDKHSEHPKQYEAPAVKVVGSFYGLTGQIDKNFNSSDGFTFMGTAIGNSSP
jgi:hypothetical protein